MEHQNLNFLQNLFLYSQQVCFWTITSDMELLYSNCPESDFFYSLFLVSSCCTAIQSHFSCSHVPLLVSDRTGFAWSAVCGPVKPNGLSLIYLLGPMFVSETTKSRLHLLCQKMNLTTEATERIWKFVDEVPTISNKIGACYASELHYCINDSAISADEIVVQTERIEHSEDVVWGDVKWHGSWAGEQRLFKSIMEGQLVYMSKDRS